MWPFPTGPGILGTRSPIDAILATGLRIAPPDTDVEPYYPEPISFERPGTVFLSHTSLDESIIRRELIAQLTPFFYQIFFMNIGMVRPSQFDQVQVIQAYKRRILRALWESHCFVVYLSSAAATSPWVQFELAWALQNKPRRRIIALLPDPAVEERLRPALRLIWQVPLFRQAWWNRLAIGYTLRRAGARVKRRN